MDLKGALHSGMRIVGPDDHDYGPIERYDDHAVYVQGQPIPLGAIQRIDEDRLYVGEAGVGHMTRSGGTSTGLGGEVRVPLLEERLEFGTRPIDLGDIRIHKTVEEREEARRGPLDREDVEIERVRVDRPVSSPEERRMEGDWLIIPIMEEVFVVQKQLMVTEEIRIRKHLVTEEHEVRDIVRREHATIEDTRTAPPTPAPARRASGRADDDDAWEELHEEIRSADR